MGGHSIADLAQFSRYEEQFSKLQKEVLVKVYNNGCELPLPDDWEDMKKWGFWRIYCK